jgi:protein subunit release factor A
MHRPTGTVFLSQSERSQWTNRQNAVEHLRAFLKYTPRSK